MTLHEWEGEKSSVDEIRARFDADVERFSQLDTGQAVVLDAPMHMELVTEAAAAVCPQAQHLLDIGCGAGNYTLKLLQRLPGLSVSLIDLSEPMLQRARQRIQEAMDAATDSPPTESRIQTQQGDVRDLDLGEGRFDIVVAAQCLHHLRGEAEWQDVFARIYRCLRPGGSFWVSDSVAHELPAVSALIRQRWGEHLVALRDEAYRDHVLAYVAREDTPRPLAWQLDRMREAGFAAVELLHKHNRFASFGAVKA